MAREEFVTRLIQFKFPNQSESGAFIRRIADCKDEDQRRKIITETKAFLDSQEEPDGK